MIRLGNVEYSFVCIMIFCFDNIGDVVLFSVVDIFICLNMVVWCVFRYCVGVMVRLIVGCLF